METYSLHWIELRHIDDSLPQRLNLFQTNKPRARLVSVMFLPRNPGEPTTYQAVWAEPQTDIGDTGR